MGRDGSVELKLSGVNDLRLYLQPRIFLSYILLFVQLCYLYIYPVAVRIRMYTCCKIHKSNRYLHSAPLQYSEKRLIRKSVVRIQPNNITPVTDIFTSSRLSCCPCAKLSRWYALEEHEHPHDDFWCRGDGHGSSLFVGILRDEAEGDVFVAEEVGEPVSVEQTDQYSQ